MARIYISSTFKDLQAERERVSAVVRQLGHEAIGMEDYTADGSRPLAKCLQDVESCDAYIGIFGWRYGHVPLDGSTNGKSITELEYRQARQLGRETLVFLRSLTGIDAGGTDKFTGEGQSGALIERLRQELEQQHVISPFGSAEELAVKAATAIANAMAKGKLLRGNSPEALKQLKRIGINIIKLYAFKRVYEELLEVYFDIRILRSERAQDITRQDLRAAASSARRRVKSSEAVLEEWRPYLSEPERKITQQTFEEFERSRARLEQLGQISALIEPGSEDQVSEIVDEFNKSLANLLNELDQRADDLWAKIKLSQLCVLLERFRSQVPLDFLGRIESGYRELSHPPPPLHSKCDILAREHDLLDKALETFSTVRREVEHLDLATLKLSCKAIRRRVEQAREQWHAFTQLQDNRHETWEVDLFGDGQDQWELIDESEKQIVAPLQQIEHTATEVPPELLDRLRRLRKALEFHFQSVDRALVLAYGRVKVSLGDELLAATVADVSCDG